jgi:pantetheine-phosphate adenylyltransferase
MKKALYSGSFDPPTKGHEDIINRSLIICDKLIIGIAVNPSKTKTFFTIDERIEMLKIMTEHNDRIEIVTINDLLVDFAKKNNIDFLIRGLRAFSDFEYEFRMALANRHIGSIETFFLMTDEKLAHISSTLIKDLALFKKLPKGFVPDSIEELVYQKLVKRS